MPTIEIVSHCYAVKLKHYASFLCYQWSSLVLHKPVLCDVLATVVTSNNDKLVDEVIRWFMSNTPLRCKQVILPEDRIGRRSIGRNHVALNTESDIVWFADVDYCFGLDCLDTLASRSWPTDAVMVFPKDVQIHKNWDTGDVYAKMVDGGPKLVNIGPGDFTGARYSRAIGGVQIVKGDFAREHGYLKNNEKYQRPSSRLFHTTEDSEYRRESLKHGRIVGINLPNVYRMRHTTNAYQGGSRAGLVEGGGA